jgi:steroid delta-isomerase-like uncharacterized protein
MKIVTAAILCSAISFCMPAHGYSQEKVNHLLAENWIRCLNSHDTVSLEKLYDKDCELLSPNWEGVKTGSAAAREVYSRYFSSTPDLQHTLTHLVVTDSVIFVEYISSGTFSNPEKNTPAYMRGKKYSLQNCTRLDVRNGKITRQVNYFDQVAFLRQVGFFNQK